MSQHTIGLIGRKVGMTQVFLPNGTMVGVSVVQVTPNTVTRLRTDERDGYSVGQQLNVGEIVAEGELVDVTGVSKGQGFAGTIKRHNFSRGPKTHGSDNYRRPGSIGPGTTPGRVYKGLKMGGHMGHERVTIKKLRVVRVDSERNLILVRGSVPGAPGALTFVKKA